jgi:hypothetical protein
MHSQLADGLHGAPVDAELDLDLLRTAIAAAAGPAGSSLLLEALSAVDAPAAASSGPQPDAFADAPLADADADADARGPEEVGWIADARAYARKARVRARTAVVPRPAQSEDSLATHRLLVDADRQALGVASACGPLTVLLTVATAQEHARQGLQAAHARLTARIAGHVPTHALQNTAVAAPAAQSLGALAARLGVEAPDAASVARPVPLLVACTVFAQHAEGFVALPAADAALLAGGAAALLSHCPVVAVVATWTLAVARRLQAGNLRDE